MKILSNKQVNHIIGRIAANQLIAEDALNRAHRAGTLTLNEFSDATSHLADNSIELASIIGGIKGISKLNDIVERYRNAWAAKNNHVKLD